MQGFLHYVCLGECIFELFLLKKKKKKTKKKKKKKKTAITQQKMSVSEKNLNLS